ncbi:uncharacterized protein BCR38DRAFT_479361 [Pseudomassariella vexata]|uniref:Apple domain-containing protein n=1 Tax=Pseudomassariella vexata TaxID=1141098 RepID=A0A1Y2D6M0_9PEZI|nr:uncharacterized protein BCR38DRAFT_479361 [Pseudomassariella vexata]ORY54726.1 hypothetical protein BCR38DRAFT_479361 [Pseudomassariella vexata]
MLQSLVFVLGFISTANHVARAAPGKPALCENVMNNHPELTRELQGMGKADMADICYQFVDRCPKKVTTTITDTITDFETTTLPVTTTTKLTTTTKTSTTSKTTTTFSSTTTTTTSVTVLATTTTTYAPEAPAEYGSASTTAEVARKRSELVGKYDSEEITAVCSCLVEPDESCNRKRNLRETWWFTTTVSTTVTDTETVDPTSTRTITSVESDTTTTTALTTTTAPPTTTKTTVTTTTTIDTTTETAVARCALRAFENRVATENEIYAESDISLKDCRDLCLEGTFAKTCMAYSYWSIVPERCVLYGTPVKVVADSSVYSNVLFFDRACVIQ